MSTWRDARTVTSEISYKRITGKSWTMTQQLKAAPLLPCLKLAKLGKLGWLIDRIEKLLPIPARSTLILLCHAESLQILGDFYLKKGQRARLPQELGSRILRLLDEASAALPA